MRIKLLISALLLGACVLIEPALAADPAVSSAAPETLSADERSALDSASRDAENRWTYDVALALLRRGEANDIALASMLLSAHSSIALAACGGLTACVDGEREQVTPTQDHAALAALALERADELSYLMLRLVALHHMKNLDEAQQDAVLESLVDRAPSDWAGWVTKLGTLKKRGVSDDQITQELLLASNAIKGSREWFYPLAREIAEAYALVPIPDDVRESSRLLNANSSGPKSAVQPDETIRLVMGIGYAMAVAIPQYQTLHLLCKDEDPQYVQRRAVCLSIAKALAINSQSVVERQLGLNLWHQLVEGSSEESLAIAAKRRHYWLIEASAQVRSALVSETKELELFVSHLKNPGSSELSYYESLLRDAGIAAEPPDAWQPLNAAVMQARR